MGRGRCPIHEKKTEFPGKGTTAMLNMIKKKAFIHPFIVPVGAEIPDEGLPINMGVD